MRYATSPEVFLAIRGAYAASLAAMSATGYAAGVGDRHLGNIMMHASGRLVPIDFGCVCAPHDSHPAARSTEYTPWSALLSLGQQKLCICGCPGAVHDGVSSGYC